MQNHLYYRPWLSRRFRMEAGLSVLGRDWGMGSLDSLFFQKTPDFLHYRQTKEEGIRENLGKYYLSDLSQAEESLFLEWVLKKASNEGLALDDLHTEPLLNFSLNISEDLSLIRISDSEAILALASIFFPNHWSPEEKFAKDFLAVHAPVPNMQKINASHLALLGAALKKDQPMVRFAWGIATDKRLNHHPTPPPGIAYEAWHGRSPSLNGSLYARVERQVLAGVPKTDLIYFSIRTYFTDFSMMNNEDLDCIRACILDMDEAILNYKGLSSCKDLVLEKILRLMS
ncbi:MAG: DUF3445 domain-containing protein [Candidatus Cloacimonetes bacterium]|nr:DUF3445 domain-containing protein [Candidatus Cloacimonadota bacterium]